MGFSLAQAIRLIARSIICFVSCLASECIEYLEQFNGPLEVKSFPFPIIGLGGVQRAGKSTCAQYLVEQGWVELANATALKLSCKESFDLSEEELFGEDKLKVNSFWGVTPRYMFQIIGTEVYRNVLPLFIPKARFIWTQLLEKKLEKLRRNNPYVNGVVISDVRFQNELDFVHRMGGRTVVVRNKQAEASLTQTHSSETLWNTGQWDMQLDNTGTVEQLHHNITTLL